MLKTDNRVAVLAQQKQSIFHTSDLGVLWDIRNRNTLYTLLKRYTKAGILFRIFKGLYSLYPINQLDPFLLGLKALHEYSYISTETVLAQMGIIHQIIHNITIISSKPMKFKIGAHLYISRKLQNKFLFNPVGIVERNGVRIAAVERAVADLLYFNSKAVFDGKRLIDIQKVKQMQQEIGYPLTQNFYVNPA